MPTDYTPISCTLHDQLEVLAMHRRPCRIIYRDEGGSERTIHDRPVDIAVSGGEEVLVLAGGERIRLDRLVSIAPEAGGSEAE
jgi:transcriptional antiterminator Rof (Rho-off)